MPNFQEQIIDLSCVMNERVELLVEIRKKGIIGGQIW